MPQAGVHAIVGIAARRWIPQREWLLLGVVLGNLFFSIGAEGLPRTILGVLYLLSIIIAIVITIRMSKTVETLSQQGGPL